ncbi:hypothetical protein JHK85_003569 [Glycine max]|nr:hypothetical protein JHK85_003569 [Glycine max]
MAVLMIFHMFAAIALPAYGDAFIGVNIGTDATNMPSPTEVVALLKAQGIQHVRLYDADRAMLRTLANTGIRVIVSVPNDQILGIGQSNATAANWVARNVIAHVPATNITAIAVGSEVLTSLPNAAPVLVSALKFIQAALVAANLDQQIKVSTPHSSSVILDSFPPSQAFFNKTWDPVMVPLLNFLQSTGSYLMLNVYPYYDYMQTNGVVPLDYALFRPLPPNKEAIDSNTLLHYTNVFDAIVDAAYFAMSYLKFTNIPILVTESGWPSKGDSSEPDATVDNANTYNSNLIRHVLNNSGTPKQPGIAVSTYIYELYNEDLRSGPVSENNWGLFYANGAPVYTLHLTNSGTVFANDTTNQTFCVAKSNADTKMLQAALDWACGPGKVDCSPLLQGQPCYEPNSVASHATYAINAYYQQMAKSAGTCDFKGVASVTTTNPSKDGGKNVTSVNGTALAPSTNSTNSGKKMIKRAQCRLRHLKSKREVMAMQIGKDLSELIQNGHQETAIMRSLTDDQKYKVVDEIASDNCLQQEVKEHIGNQLVESDGETNHTIAEYTSTENSALVYSVQQYPPCGEEMEKEDFPDLQNKGETMALGPSSEGVSLLPYAEAMVEYYVEEIEESENFESKDGQEESASERSSIRVGLRKSKGAPKKRLKRRSSLLERQGTTENGCIIYYQQPCKSPSTQNYGTTQYNRMRKKPLIEGNPQTKYNLDKENCIQSCQSQGYTKRKAFNLD